ncbi:hypothetical protein Pure05_01510 [Paenarthrobacter ureafaciens]|nr:hypothetical protein Pure02_01500 [Paenarthrobacter ureafaciens]GLU66174.1 hypothetical protein Pure03_01500 [Paenarthrobacter ureafaciens]GLU71502.1 hypothetical protein Pure04_12170 [Paenarthrobacter ureafaciens]GLU74711.1 hypothetical protein Pure05_01510 [Paenarthrobacter ureafaciens]
MHSREGRESADSRPSLCAVVEDIRVERIEATPLVDPPRIRLSKPNELPKLPPIGGHFKSHGPALAYSLAS